MEVVAEALAVDESTAQDFAIHPAWVLLAQDDALAWRRCACREHDAMSDQERAKGGLLKILQSEDSPQRLNIPAGTRGGLTAYAHSTVEL